QTWNTTNYVVYDLGDRDARTFGYFIDRNVADFIQFDGLLMDTLQYQLKYRFKIDKNYFGDEISTKTFFDMEELTVQMYYNPIKSVVALNPQLKFSADLTDIIFPDGSSGSKNHINELSFDIDWINEVIVADSEVDGIDINEVFHNFVLYSNYVTLYVLDKYDNLYEIDKANDKFYLQNSNEQNIYDFIKERHGRYYVDFKLDYEWELRGMISYIYNAIFNVEASIELTNVEVRAKVTSVNKEIISPISMPENGTIVIGDIAGNLQNDIGFMGGFLEETDNNDRFYIKYGFNYLFDADNNDIFNASDPQIYFAEFIQDIKFSSAEVEGFIYYDGNNFNNKTIILGDGYLFDLTTTSNVDEVNLYTDLAETEAIGTTIFNA
ncbi:hypothetical protein LCGC14_2935970, partial [marine sediment metagenome]